MRFIIDRLPAGMRVSTPVLVSAAAVGVSAVVVAFGVGAIGRSLLQPSIAADKADPLGPLTDGSSKLLEQSRKRFEGRSMYSLPPMPVRRPKIVEQPKPVEQPKVDLGPPPAPASYTGPAPTSVIGETVYFGTDTVKLGQTEKGITVIAITSSASIKLGYQRGEYDVPLLPKMDSKLMKPASSSGLTVGGAGGSSASSSGAAASGSATGAAGGAGAAGTAVGGAAGPRVGGAAGAAGFGGPRVGTRNAPGTATPVKPGDPNANPNTNPNNVGPGEQPGADRPSGPGPEGEPQLPSQAMKPQKFEPPASSNDKPVEEYVDREQLPPTLTDVQISAMNRDQARAALAAIDATNSWNVDDHSRARLNHERQLLQARISKP